MIERVHDDTSTYDPRNFSCRVSLFTGSRLNNIFFVSNDIKYIYTGKRKSKRKLLLLLFLLFTLLLEIRPCTISSSTNSSPAA